MKLPLILPVPLLAPAFVSIFAPKIAPKAQPADLDRIGYDTIKNAPPEAGKEARQANLAALFGGDLSVPAAPVAATPVAAAPKPVPTPTVSTTTTRTVTSDNLTAEQRAAAEAWLKKWREDGRPTDETKFDEAKTWLKQHNFD